MMDKGNNPADLSSADDEDQPQATNIVNKQSTS
jgi:hypothetical protein